jgi:translation initiation factor 2 alpha subunit (eIF-2alpha)
MARAASDVEETVGIFEGLAVDGEAKESILSQAKRRLEPQPVQIRSDIEARSG